MGTKVLGQLLGNVVNQTKVIFKNFPISLQAWGDSVEGSKINSNGSIEELAWLLCSRWSHYSKTGA
jgi:hypothetical protein